MEEFVHFFYYINFEVKFENGNIYQSSFYLRKGIAKKDLDLPILMEKFFENFIKEMKEKITEVVKKMFPTYGKILHIKIEPYKMN